MTDPLYAMSPSDPDWLRVLAEEAEALAVSIHGGLDDRRDRKAREMKFALLRMDGMSDLPLRLDRWQNALGRRIELDDDESAELANLLLEAANALCGKVLPPREVVERAVYVVFNTGWEDTLPVAAFTTEEQAREFAEVYDKFWSYRIGAMVLDTEAADVRFRQLEHEPSVPSPEDARHGD